MYGRKRFGSGKGFMVRPRHLLPECVPVRDIAAMTATELNELLKLPSAERLALIEKLWESLTPAPESVPLPEAHLQELDRRLDHPAPGAPLTPDQLTARLRQRP